ncbi:MAG: Ig-like domain-containing protein [Prevotella sp.]|jgi:uncharacterized protein YjdB|nr:Ig-like domain-containing protein [Prevotella sp.]
MKTYIKYLLVAFCVLSGAGLLNYNCSDDYKYGVDSRFYDGMTVKVKNTVDNVLRINIDNKDQISLEITPEDIVLDTRAFTYAVTGDSIFTIDVSGNITPLKVGSAELKVVFRANNQITAGCKVEIYKDPVSVEQIIVPDAVKNCMVEIGKTFDLGSRIVVLPGNADNKELDYRVENGSLATIDGKGVITGIAEGATKIIMTTKDGTNITAECNLQVVPEVKVGDIVLPPKLDGLTIGLNETLNIAYVVKVEPENASNKTLKYEVANGSAVTVDANGLIKPVATGVATIRVSSTDADISAGEKNVTKEFTITVDGNVSELTRALWTVSTSHALPSDAAISNGPTSHLDGVNTTCISMVKPGKSVGGVTVPSGDVVWFIIDRKNNDEFNYFKIRHRNTSQLMLRVRKVSFYGSNDGGAFTEIKAGIDIPDATSSAASAIESGNVSLPPTSYRFIKMTYDAWDTASGSSMQIAEFNLGKQ